VTWRLLRERAGAAQLHAGREHAVRTVVECTVTAPALVLGSTQPLTDVRPDASARLDVVRRRSGGGAVLVEPDGVVWIDVFVPTGDPLWSDDVAHAFWWLGEAWAATLSSLGMADLTVHRGPLVSTRWSRIVCFAGLGAGEVIDAGGRKVVGIAQRRTRAGALFQCAAPLRWDAQALVDALVLPPEAAADLAAVARPLPNGTSAGDVGMALLAHFRDHS
jgi:lipoate-protein ligase A